MERWASGFKAMETESDLENGGPQEKAALTRSRSAASQLRDDREGMTPLDLQNSNLLGEREPVSIERVSLSTSVMREGMPENVHGLMVSFKNLTYTVRSRKQHLTLLDDVTGFFKPGEMTALVGPSGSGKTTLLDVLAGRKTAGKVEGQILFGNEPPTKAFLRRRTGYVEQFDTLVENMTVFEMLFYTAQMKLPHTMGKASKKRAVEDLLQRLGLEQARNTLIGGQSLKGISGGQAKRVNIGVSLITDPYVLFLDEPTSGLDSFTADEVMMFVKSFAGAGITICATIHSPSPKCFELFDSLGLLVQGKFVYFGKNLRHATDYFYEQGLSETPFQPESDFPADWLVALVTSANRLGDEEVQKFTDTYKNTLAKKVEKDLGREIEHINRENLTGAVTATMKLDARSKYSTSTPEWWALAVYFHHRTLKNLRDPLFLSARIVDKAIVVSIAASLFYGQASSARDECSFRSAQQTAAALFMWTAAPMFSAAAYLPTFMLERALFRRERSDGIFNFLTYYVAKWIEEVIIAVPFSLVFCGIVYASIGLIGNFGVFWITWLLTLLTAIGLSFCFAMLSPTLDFANGSVPSYGGTLLYFMGFLISLNEIPPWWTWYSYFDFLRHGYVAIMVNEFRNYNLIGKCSGRFDSTFGILEAYGMQDLNAGHSIGYLMIFLVVFWCGALFLLKYLKYGSR
uniref:p-loop containing nucleoside triphosphate hydrolase protein n=1 Tax=Tetraselmis sp. GSL018 TaxID=582737 RepID=A0A061SAM0_9CHLO